MRNRCHKLSPNPKFLGSAMKYALVTGASLGIGYEVCVALSKKGYKVLGCAPKLVEWALNELTRDHGVYTFTCDITSKADLDRAAEIVQEQTGGRLDVLYNNAGISYGGPAIEMEENQVDRIFQVNVIGHINMTKTMSDFVIAAKGSIVFTASVAARVMLPFASVYCATKAAIDQYALCLHSEMEPFGVRVHSVITGGVNTAICDTNQITSFAKLRYNVEGVYQCCDEAANMSRNPRTSISPAKYADQVVRKITARRDPGFNLYHGHGAYLLHCLSRYVPLWLTEFLIQNHFRQLKMFRNIRKQVRNRDKLK